MRVGALLRDAETSAEWHLDEGESWTLGRGASSDIALSNDTVRRAHLRIEFASGGWHAQDLGSDHGTLLNGVGVRGREELRSGDVLRVGGVLLLFRSDGRPPRAREKRTGSGIHRLPLPQSFDALMILFTAPLPSVEAAIISARAGEALLRFCELPERRESLSRAYSAGLTASWPVVRSICAHGIAALAAVGALDGSKAGARVVTLLSDPDQKVQSSAAVALAEIDPLAAAPRLLARATAVLSEPGHSPREAAERAGMLARVADEGLLSDLRVRAEAVAFDAHEPDRRARAAAVLGELTAAGEAKALRALRSLLSDPDEEVRLQSVAALARAGGDEAREALRGLLDDPSPRVFRETCRALATARDPELASLLVAILAGTPASEMERRARLRRALEDVTGERRGPDPAAWLASPASDGPSRPPSART